MQRIRGHKGKYYCYKKSIITFPVYFVTRKDSTTFCHGHVALKHITGQRKVGLFTGRELNLCIKLSFTLLNIYEIK